MTPDGPLARWSQRKLAGPDGAARPATDVAPAATAAAVEAQPAVEAHPAVETEAEFLARNGLPDPDTLRRGDDFGAFMRAGVPALLRRRALRRLWTSNPVLACLDGLNDYDGDYTSPGPSAMKTAYRVGRGLLGDGDATPAEQPGEGATPGNRQDDRAETVDGRAASEVTRDVPSAQEATVPSAARAAPAAPAEPADAVGRSGLDDGNGAPATSAHAATAPSAAPADAVGRSGSDDGSGAPATSAHEATMPSAAPADATGRSGSDDGSGAPAPERAEIRPRRMRFSVVSGV